MEVNPFTSQPEWNPMAVGPRRYGDNASFTATSGKLPAEGYRQRSKNQARRQAVQQRLRQMMTASPVSPEQIEQAGRVQ